LVGKCGDDIAEGLVREKFKCSCCVGIDPEQLRRLGWATD